MYKTLSAYTIPHTVQWPMHSENGREYQISMYIPKEPAPAEGYPILYILDANAIFGSAVEAVRLQNGERGGQEPTVVVGIGYPTDEPFHKEREADYAVSVSGEAGKPCGADSFITFIENQLKPEIAKMVGVNKKKEALFGHSLGGFFTLYTLFNRPDLFQTYIAGSPLIGKGDRCLTPLEQVFYDKLREWEEQGNIQYKMLLIGVGAAEERMMLEEVRDLHTRLSDWQLSNFESDLRIFFDEGHISVLHPLISRAVAHFFE